MSLTNFSVSFKRQVKPADYESGASEVILSGVFEEGASVPEVLNEAALLAKAQVLQLVGKAPAVVHDVKSASTNAVAAAPKEAIVERPTPAAAPSHEGPKGRGRPAGAKNKPKEGPTETPAANVQSDLEEMLGGSEAAPAPVSDEDLIQAVRKHADVVGPEKIKAHVQDYLGKLLPLPKGELQRVRQVKEIPQAHRAEFIKGMGGLK